ncbi:hypothetical protein QZR14_05285 [Pseudomonas sp. rhizo66]|uniref:hypothetical protein n=1 Tax=Pseudomonas sp. rhizo66 TaxID=3059674 RepID=UPI00288DC045|nr:hypothetical protein [Pseudomonas sp. rhizo66]MDT3310766.1 hypothetical protein [Pseudomonas sp. rhizo66]
MARGTGNLHRMPLCLTAESAARRQLMMGLRLGLPRRKVAGGAGFSDFWRLVWAQPAVYLDQPLAVCAATTRIFRIRPKRRIPCFVKAFYKKIEEHI